MTTQPQHELCAEVTASLAEVLDGTARAPLYEHLAECDTCRDARHDAEQVRALAVAAGADHEATSELEQRVLAALEREPEHAPAGSDGAEGREQDAPRQPAPSASKQWRADRRVTGAVLLLAAAAAVVVAFRGAKQELRG